MFRLYKIITLVILVSFQSITFSQTKVTVKIHTFKDYNGYEDFATKAAQKLEFVLNSESFRKEIINGKFKKTNGLSNQQVYDLIIKAREVQGPGGNDGVVDLRVRTITIEQDGERWIKNCKPNSWAGTIGIDGQGDGVTAICSERLKLWAETNDYAQLAAHYTHEYMHILGFSHNGLGKSKTLVYKVGDIIERLIKNKV